MQFELLLLLQPLIVQVLVYLLVDLRGGDGADGGGRVGGRQGLGGVLVTTLVVSVLVRSWVWRWRRGVLDNVVQQKLSASIVD